MGYRSTAKQRLWLTCLGYDVSATTDGNEVREVFEDASSSRRYQAPPTTRQRRLAQLLGIGIDESPTCHDAAGKLYHVLLLQAWVYSVWRSVSGEKARNHIELGLPAATALSLAREMNAAEMFDLIDQFATTDGREADVFYRMSKPAQASEPYRYAAERLPQPTARPAGGRRSSAHEEPNERRPARRRTVASVQQSKGCALLVAYIAFAVAVLAAGCAWVR